MMNRLAARLILLSTLLALSVFALVTSMSRPAEPLPDSYQVSRQLPEVTPPSGALVEVFEGARPASLKVEMRNVHGLRSDVVGIGTGFFISADGLVLSAYHVVDPPGAGIPMADLQLIGVALDESRYHLELIGFDAYFDLALLQADIDGPVPYIPLADRAPQVGTEVVAIGNSRGDFLDGRAGEVKGLGMAAPRPDLAENTIALTAALSPGDSGGPVLNPNGEAFGVVSYISYGSGEPPTGDNGFVPPYLRGLVGVNRFASFAIPVTNDNEVLAAVLAGEMRDVPVIGFTWAPGYDYDPTLPRWQESGLGERPGVIVRSVEPGGPADLAGLRNYQEHFEQGPNGEPVTRIEADVIVAVNGVATPSFYELLGEVRRHEIGEAVTLAVQRGDESIELELTLAGRRTTFRR